MLGRRHLLGGAVEQVNFDEATLSGPGRNRRVQEYRFLTIQACEPRKGHGNDLLLPIAVASFITGALCVVSLLILHGLPSFT